MAEERSVLYRTVVRDVICFNSPLCDGTDKKSKTGYLTLSKALAVSNSTDWETLVKDAQRLDGLGKWLDELKDQPPAKKDSDVVVVGRFPQYPEWETTWLPVSLKDLEPIGKDGELSFFVRLNLLKKPVQCTGPLHFAIVLRAPLEISESAKVSFKIVPVEDYLYRFFSKSESNNPKSILFAPVVALIKIEK